MSKIDILKNIDQKALYPLGLVLIGLLSFCIVYMICRDI